MSKPAGTVKMPKLGRLLVAIGFLWISLWAVVGSLLGAKINWALFHSDQIWLGSTQRELIRAAHAHMNTFAILLVLMGLSSNTAIGIAGIKNCQRIAGAACLGTVTFGLGLVLEAFYPTERGDLSPLVLLTGVGGTFVMAAFAAWGLIFVWGYKRLR
jgi:hypothetical protein